MNFVRNTSVPPSPQAFPLTLLALVFVLGCGDDTLPILDTGLFDTGPGADVTLPDAGTRLDVGSPDAPSDVGAPDASADGGLDASPTCELEPCLVEWIQGPDLPRAVDHHTTAILGPPSDRYLVVIGGVETTRGTITGMSADVMLAPVQADGSLGEFMALDMLANPISFHAQTITEDGHALILGGISQRDGMPFALPNVLFFGLDASDPRGFSIVSGTDLPSVFRHATAEIVGERLYIIAGLSGSGPQDTVLVSTLEGGTNGPWVDAPSLPRVRTHHASVVYEDRIYIFGGFDENDMPLTDILRSTHDADGGLMGWEVLGTWEAARWTASGFVHDGHMYLVGGGRGQGFGARALATVVRAEFLDEGIGPFEEVESPLPMGRAHVHQLPFVDGVLYSVGGRAGSDFSSTREVQVGRLVSE